MIRRSVIFIIFLLVSSRPTDGHSMMSWPTGFSNTNCRLGGEFGGFQTCEGPCDMRAIEGGYARHASPSDPSAVLRRGAELPVKYQRNNHGPGGFNRLTLVPVDKMMDKSEHKNNAFFYSCWGANAVPATDADLQHDHLGFSVAGNDGEQHGFPKAYYRTIATVPECVPDGDYVLGWVWFGGCGGPVEGNGPQEPKDWGYFSDYWSCAFVRVEGGAPLKSTCPVVFDNDMSEFSTEGCMSANDETGVCSTEPCRVTGKYQLPKPFQNGNTPLITAAQFGANDEDVTDESATQGTATTTPPTVAMASPDVEETRAPEQPVSNPSRTATPTPSPTPTTSPSSMPSLSPMPSSSPSPMPSSSQLPSSSPSPSQTLSQMGADPPAEEEESQNVAGESAPTIPDATAESTAMPTRTATPSPTPITSPEQQSEEMEPDEDRRENNVDTRLRASTQAARAACHCFLAGRSCRSRTARKSLGRCRSRTFRSRQRSSCLSLCCTYCGRKEVLQRDAKCRKWQVRAFCRSGGEHGI